MFVFLLLVFTLTDVQAFFVGYGDTMEDKDRIKMRFEDPWSSEHVPPPSHHIMDGDFRPPFLRHSEDFRPPLSRPSEDFRPPFSIHREDKPQGLRPGENTRPQGSRSRNNFTTQNSRLSIDSRTQGSRPSENSGFQVLKPDIDAIRPGSGQAGVSKPRGAKPGEKYYRPDLRPVGNSRPQTSMPQEDSRQDSRPASVFTSPGQDYGLGEDYGPDTNFSEYYRPNLRPDEYYRNPDLQPNFLNFSPSSLPIFNSNPVVFPSDENISRPLDLPSTENSESNGYRRNNISTPTDVSEISSTTTDMPTTATVSDSQEGTTKIPRRDPTNRIVYTVPCPCPYTRQYVPACGTDGQTYGNIGILQCAQKCGSGVKVFLMGACGRNNGHPGAISLKYK